MNRIKKVRYAIQLLESVRLDAIKMRAILEEADLAVGNNNTQNSWDPTIRRLQSELRAIPARLEELYKEEGMEMAK